jgi:hypothetical protein
MTESRTPYRLANAVERNQIDPDDFLIPSAAERQSLRRGWLAKLVFEPGEDAGDDESPERMFVEVMQVVDGRYAGRLTNEPVSLSAPAYGDLIDFGPDNVIDVVRPNRLRKMLKRQSPHREHLVFTKSYVCFHVFNAVSGPRSDGRESRPTLYAAVDTDGDLVFGCGHSDHEESAADWKVIHPAHVVQDDHTRKMLSRINTGEVAERTSASDPWVTAPDPDL